MYRKPMRQGLIPGREVGMFLFSIMPTTAVRPTYLGIKHALEDLPLEMKINGAECRSLTSTNRR
jgi:hypothetical protein